MNAKGKPVLTRLLQLLQPHPLAREGTTPRPTSRPFLLNITRLIGFVIVFIGIILTAAFTTKAKQLVLLRAKEQTLPHHDFDLPHVLNVTAYIDRSQAAPRTALTYAAHSDIQSVAAAYLSLPLRCATRPTVTHLRKAIEIVVNGTKTTYKSRILNRAYSIAAENDTLTLQLDPNVAGSDDAVVEYIAKRATDFRKILLVPPPPRALELSTSNSRNNPTDDFTNIIYQTGRKTGARVEIFRGRPGALGTDDDLLVMHMASHLAVQGGSRGALAALTTHGDVELAGAQALRNFLAVDAFRWAVTNLVPEAIPSYPERESLDGMGHILDSCCEFQEFGSGDGGKIACTNTLDFGQAPCWVLSLGCNNKWSFESDIVRHTQCAVHVYDCTGDFSVPKHLVNRVTLHKLCIGKFEDKENNFLPWTDLVAIGASLSGLPNDTAPSIAKIDVEGWEMPTVADFVSSNTLLPQQMLIEVHVAINRKVGYPFEDRVFMKAKYGLRRETVSNWFANLSVNGYDLVHRADNPYCKHCSEVTLVHRSFIPRPN